MSKIKELIKITLILCLLVFNSSMTYSQSNEKFENKFVIVLDVQEEFTKNLMSEITAKKLIDSVNYIIENTNPRKIIYVRDTTVHKVLTISFKGVTIDTTLSKYDLDDRMELVNDNIFCKSGVGSAFKSNELISFLEQNNAKEIIVVGLMAEECVSATLNDGKELGYDMYVIPEAIVGKSKNSKNKALKKLKKNGIKFLRL